MPRLNVALRIPPPENASPTNSPAPNSLESSALRVFKIASRSVSNAFKNSTAWVRAVGLLRNILAIVTPTEKTTAIPALVKSQIVQSPPNLNRARLEPEHRQCTTAQLSITPDGIAMRPA